MTTLVNLYWYDFLYYQDRLGEMYRTLETNKVKLLKYSSM